ncbi:hypothetical protein SERIO_v1c01140 [Spiroplasma eriocheiris]|uniref:MG406 family protein n=1 Tax=Spiroplasma eriocheiris TaxID=315358 RepID=A0A0H3XIY0_9MOLU|nr:hypothetical protein SERIO_v1c01140 [Spiroplasma eriocheiris]
MQEIGFLEPNKKNKLIWKNKFKGVEYKMSMISVIALFGILIIVTILYLTLKWSWTLYSGLMLGYLFSLIGFLIILFSGWLLSISLNKYFFVLMYLVRLMIYAIPIIIYAYWDEYFNIFTIIIGLSIFSFSALFLNIKLPKRKKRGSDG